MRDRTLLAAARRICRRLAGWYPPGGDCPKDVAAAFLDDAMLDAWHERGWRGGLQIVAVAIADLARARACRASLPLTQSRGGPRFTIHTRRASPASPRASLMDRLIGDFRYALRTLRRTPAFTAVAVATLGLGIGATTAVYAVVDGVLLRPFSYPHMDRLVLLNEVTAAGQTMSIAWPNFEDWRAGNDAFEEIGVYRGAAVAIVGGDSAERLNGSLVSASVFASMGIAPLAGRTFNESDDAPGAERVAIISERVWRGRFGARADIVGLPVTLNNQPFTIAGVMPAGMRFPSRLTDVWLPLGLFVNTFPRERGAHPGLMGVARLKPGVDVDRARASMAAVAARLAEQYPASNRGNGIAVNGYYELIVQNIRPVLGMLLGAVGMLLLIACSNLASLMLARAESRHRELAVRAALGASRVRLIRQVLMESAILAAAGGMLGIALAYAGVRAFVDSQPTTVPRIDLVGIDWRVLLFAAAVATVTVVLFGLLPALRASRPDLQFALRTTRAGSGRRAVHLRRLLVAGQVAIAAVLLVGAGLFARSLVKLTSIELGFDPARVLTMRLNLPEARYATTGAWIGFHRTLLDRLAGLPGAETIGINSAVPLEGGGSESGVLKEGDPPPAPGRPLTPTLFQATGGDYFRAMGIELLSGRVFDARDRDGSTPVAVVDDTLAAKLFGGENPVGRRIAFEFKGHDPASRQMLWREVVGVVRHVKHYGIIAEPPFVQVYAPFEQLPIWMHERRPAMALLVRTSADPDAMVSTIRRSVAAIDPTIPVYGVQPLRALVAQSTEQPRLSAMLVTAFAGLALLLAAVGVYGVLAYVVSQRTREIGVRVALGARGQDIVRQIVLQGLVLAAAGVAVGLAGAAALASLVGTLLYEVSPRDATSFAGTAALLVVVAAIASVIPARRAASVDPLVALRSE
jgi:putative ABC transport system permease protein